MPVMQQLRTGVISVGHGRDRSFGCFCPRLSESTGPGRRVIDGILLIRPAVTIQVSALRPSSMDGFPCHDPGVGSPEKRARWFVVGGAGAVVFLVAVILFVVLKVTEGDAGRADQLASVISMIVGLASLLVTVVGVVGGVRSSGAAAPMMTPEQIFASDLRDLIGRSGKPSQQILNSELAAYPGLGSDVQAKLGGVLQGRHRPDSALASAGALGSGILARSIDLGHPCRLRDRLADHVAKPILPEPGTDVEDVFRSDVAVARCRLQVTSRVQSVVHPRRRDDVPDCGRGRRNAPLLRYRHRRLHGAELRAGARSCRQTGGDLSRGVTPGGSARGRTCDEPAISPSGSGDGAARTSGAPHQRRGTSRLHPRPFGTRSRAIVLTAS